MKQRPLSVTIIAWFLIVTSILSLLNFMGSYNTPVVQRVMAASPLPIGAQIALSIFGVVVALVCGAGILKGKNWGRWVYVGWGVAGIVLGLVTSPFKSMILLSVVFLAVIAFFLFRKPANAWFTPSGDAASA